MGLWFNAEFGSVVVLPYYANNEICLQEVRFSVPYDEWNEFENSQLFRDLVQYEKDLERRIQDMRTERREQECRLENPALIETQTRQPSHESFFARFRNKLRNIRFR